MDATRLPSFSSLCLAARAQALDVAARTNDDGVHYETDDVLARAERWPPSGP